MRFLFRELNGVYIDPSVQQMSGRYTVNQGNVRNQGTQGLGSYNYGPDTTQINNFANQIIQNPGQARELGLCPDGSGQARFILRYDPQTRRLTIQARNGHIEQARTYMWIFYNALNRSGTIQTNLNQQELRNTVNFYSIRTQDNIMCRLDPQKRNDLLGRINQLITAHPNLAGNLNILKNLLESANPVITSQRFRELTAGLNTAQQDSLLECLMVVDERTDQNPTFNVALDLNSVMPPGYHMTGRTAVALFDATMRDFGDMFYRPYLSERDSTGSRLDAGPMNITRAPGENWEAAVDRALDRLRFTTMNHDHNSSDATNRAEIRAYLLNYIRSHPALNNATSIQVATRMVSGGSNPTSYTAQGGTNTLNNVHVSVRFTILQAGTQLAGQPGQNTGQTEFVDHVIYNTQNPADQALN